jgi:hypothetical protein
MTRLNALGFGADGSFRPRDGRRCWDAPVTGRARGGVFPIDVRAAASTAHVAFGGLT